ncbi:MAG: BMC domain-containing protein [Lachnospiraceae bacterium]|nr:BMC domain-containing protein [Lachnospiraceae bacterium]
MKKAIGMIECKTVSSGIMATDMMAKTALIDIIEAQTVCPGKYIAVISGELSAVKAAIDAAKASFAEHLISSFVLGNPDEAIFPAIYGGTDIININALGILETYDAASIIVAADVAAKTALVELIELRIARGMCGKSYLMLTGEVAAVTAAIERAKAHIGDDGMYLDSSVIARPDEKTCRAIL